MNTRFLETLVWLTRLRSFSRVAEKLNASQPAISNRIQKLEELLGTKLYSRSARQFELTAAGRRILRHAEEIVALSAELHELAALDNESDAHLRIGVIEAVTLSWLPLFVERITKQFPRAIVEFTTDTTSNLIQELRDGYLDLACIVGPINEPAIQATHLCNMEMAWAASPDHFDCDKLYDVIELSQLPVLMPAPDSSGYAMLVEYFRSAGIVNLPAAQRNVVIDCIYSLGTASQLVRCGLGVTALPLFVIGDDIAGGRLKRLQVSVELKPLLNLACWTQPMTNPIIQRLATMAASTAADYPGNVPP